MNRVSGHDDIDNLLNMLAAAPTREEIIQWFKENLSWALNSEMIQGFKNLAVWALRPDIMHWLVLAGSPMVGVIAALVTWRIVKARKSADTRAVAAELLPNNWHALDSDEVFEQLRVDSKGLASDEVRRRRNVYGLNRLPEAKTRGPLARFFAQFNNLLIYVLLGAAAITAALSHWLDAGVILGVVVINAIIGFVQEGKAEDALRAIRRMLSPQAIVLRDAQRVTVPAAELVPGDVVLLQSGDKVPADLRLFRVKNLQIQEAVLTGESVAVEKRVDAVADDAALGDRRSMAYSGTLVTYGQGAGVISATGAQTEIGHISALVAQVQTLTTPLLRRMAQFGRWLTGVILVIAAATFAFGVLARDYSPAEMFLAAVGLAVAAIPEGLPAIMTITLAIGVQRMARRHAIIRRLPAMETLGSVTVICTDKTGTLTRNEMTVRAVATADGLFEVSGVGYEPHGGFLLNEKEIDPDDYPILAELMRAAILCNDATLAQTDDEWIMQGDPTEGALLALGLKAGMDPKFQNEAWPRSDIIPFESEHRFMATLHHDHTGQGFTYVKGAPERLLEICSYQTTGGEAEAVALDRDLWHGHIDSMASQGQRLLAFAFRPADRSHCELRFTDVQSGLTLLGMVGMIDPPSEEAVHAVRQCKSAGIRVKMITGDHAVTAVAIGAQMGISDGGRMLAGHEIESLDEGQLRSTVDEVDIFARSSPEHKLRLVRALQSNGHVVAMTGDGVNDAPALKRADVGIAMGQRGTEAAKEASEIVLANDDFASIASAVEEGRTVYDNLRKSILFILPTNGGEALTLITAILLGFHELPITPIQILWINMITAVTLALALAFEPSEQDVMRRPPRDPRGPMLPALFVWRIVFVSVILVVGTFGLFLWEQAQGAGIEHARTVAVNTLVLFEVFYLLNCRYIAASAFSFEGLFGNRYVWLVAVLVILFQIGFTHLGFMQTLFGTTDINFSIWGRIILVAASVFILVELEKSLVRFFLRRRDGNSGRKDVSTKIKAGQTP